VPETSERLFLVANLAPEHMGGHFVAAARSCGIALESADTREAWAGPALLRRLSYHFAGRRPTALDRFSQRVVSQCLAVKPTVLLATGIAPLNARALRAIRAGGVRCVNYLTDDPWNRANGAHFFWDALRAYDTIYSPRTANMPDLRALCNTFHSVITRRFTSQSTRSLTTSAPATNATSRSSEARTGNASL
jgi:hypothetical protein